MKRILIFGSALFICFNSCKNETKKPIVTKPKIEFKHEASLTIKDSLNSIKSSLEIELATNKYEQQTGLMYRTSMKENRGMLFAFDKSEMKSFYMKNTYIPLDIIFIDYNKEIINIAKDVKPLSEQSVFSETPAMYVLEINAGLSDKWNLQKGDVISFEALQQ